MDIRETIIFIHIYMSTHIYKHTLLSYIFCEFFPASSSANPNGRWSFIQSSWTGGASSNLKNRGRKLLSRSMQKRILHHKQRLHDIETAKNMIEKAKSKVCLIWCTDTDQKYNSASRGETEKLLSAVVLLWMFINIYKQVFCFGHFIPTHSAA